VLKWLKPIQTSIRNKFLVVLLLLSIVPLVVFGIVAERGAEAAVRKDATNHLASTGTLRLERIQTLFAYYGLTVETEASSPDLQERLAQLTAGQGDKDQLAQELSARLRPVIQRVPGGHSILLIDSQGIVLTDTLPAEATYRGQDRSGDPAFSGALSKPGEVYIKPLYSSAAGVPAAAVSVTVSGADGKIHGVLVMRVTMTEVDKFLLDDTGMGESGESYLVVNAGKTDKASKKALMGTQSRFAKDSALHQQVDTMGSQAALAGKTGVAVYSNYRGVSVLGHYTYVPELQAGLLTETEEAEAFAPVYRLRWTTICLVLGMATVVVVTGYWLSGALIKQIRQFQELFTQIGMGNFKARAEVISDDELGSLAISLNAMLDNTLHLIQSREERDRIQEAIQKLLDEISEVAQGDLTKEAEVTGDLTGAIADSFNHMISELRQIISSVQHATLQVSTSANEIQTTAEHLANGSETQSAQILNTSAAVDEMAGSIKQVSENAASSTRVAEQALGTARTGSAAVANTIHGMTRIREQVQETSKRIKRLGESSQQIGEIVQLIDDITDRTSILALNASIQAAMAGEAGRGFAVVAEEVERLAERCTDATKKIATLVKSIQTETTEAVIAMEDGTREVVEGSKLANQAGQALSEIERVTIKLADLIQSISLASGEQARASEKVVLSMNEISEVTQQTAAGTKQAAVSVNQLAILADDLRGSLSRFKLSGPNRRGSGLGLPLRELAGGRLGKPRSNGSRSHEEISLED
jgi:methyl-accepting chemotaxis protein